MVKVCGTPLINRTLGQLDQLGLSRIVLVVGYEREKLIRHIDSLDISTPIEYVENSIYDKTNNIYSLFLAREYLLKEDTLLLESDIIFDDSVLRCLVEDPRDSLALAAKYESWMDGTCLLLSDQDDIEAMIPGSKFRFSDIDHYYKTVNLYKFSREFSRTHYVPFLEAYTAALGNNEYYEQVLKVLVSLDDPGIKAKRLAPDQLWYEIDDIQDLDIAESLFAPGADRTALLQRRYGGYWRYPKLLDFCYLVNPYFPNKRLKEEIKSNFDTLLTEYPSGMRVNAQLAARYADIHPEQIIVGNGAAELINTYTRVFPSCPTGITLPTFEEYPNRLEPEHRIPYLPDNGDFSYTSSDLIAFFRDKGIRQLIVINPDNPSGNLLSKAELLSLIDWTRQEGIRLIVDESFLDFAHPENRLSLLNTELLDENPHLVVIKSISKSYGVPGLRLGFLASGDRSLIEAMKREISIWNINSFAEFYMQIFIKYKEDYNRACERFLAERERFQNNLRKIPFLRVIPSEANYFLCEVLPPFTSEKLCAALLEKDILIKNCATKAGFNGRQYIRIAICDQRDNDRLTEALSCF